MFNMSRFSIPLNPALSSDISMISSGILSFVFLKILSHNLLVGLPTESTSEYMFLTSWDCSLGETHSSSSEGTKSNSVAVLMLNRSLGVYSRDNNGTMPLNPLVK